MKLLLANQSTTSFASVTEDNWLESIHQSVELDSFSGDGEVFNTVNGQLLLQLNWSVAAIDNSSYEPDQFDYLDHINQSVEDGDQLQKNYSSPYLMPWLQQSAWIVVFTLMLVVATVGNALVAWIVLGTLVRLCKLTI